MAACFKAFMGKGQKFYLDGRTFLALELSAVLLRPLKDDAERYPGEPVGLEKDCAQHLLNKAFLTHEFLDGGYDIVVAALSSKLTEKQIYFLRCIAKAVPIDYNWYHQSHTTTEQSGHNSKRASQWDTYTLCNLKRK